MAVTILFTGYAPVHFVCFRPLYERLVELPGVEVLLSGGLRNELGDKDHHDATALYAPFGVPSDHILPSDRLHETEVDVFFSANTNRIEPRRAALTVEIFHGMSFRNRAIRPPASGELADLFFVLGPYMMRGFQRAGLAGPDDPRLIKIGFPKTDRLLDGSLSRRSVLEDFGFAGDRPVVLYAPAGANGNSLQTWGTEPITRLAATDRYDVVVKLHDHPRKPEKRRSQLAALEDDHTRLVRAPDVVPSLFAADLLITDASSVSNEYALLDRPMVFLDVPELIAREMVRGGSMLDLETWGRRAGTVVHDPDELVVAVAEGLTHPELHRDIRQEMVRDLFYNPGAATTAAMRWASRHLGIGTSTSVRRGPRSEPANR